MRDAAVKTLRENGQLEAKRAKGGVPESVWETYSAFANTNGGLIILGAEGKARGGGRVRQEMCRTPNSSLRNSGTGCTIPRKSAPTFSRMIRSPLRRLTTATLSAFEFLAPISSFETHLHRRQSGKGDLSPGWRGRLSLLVRRNRCHDSRCQQRAARRRRA